MFSSFACQQWICPTLRQRSKRKGWLEQFGWTGSLCSSLESREQPTQEEPPSNRFPDQQLSLERSLKFRVWINLADIQLKDGELNWARSWRCIAGLSKLVFWASWRSTESGNALKVDVVTENIYLMFEFYINFLCAATAGERHYALVLNIGTFTEEEFLNMPSTLVFRLSSCSPGPWRPAGSCLLELLELQEVSSSMFCLFVFIMLFCPFQGTRFMG